MRERKLRLTVDMEAGGRGLGSKNRVGSRTYGARSLGEVLPQKDFPVLVTDTIGLRFEEFVCHPTKRLAWEVGGEKAFSRCVTMNLNIWTSSRFCLRASWDVIANTLRLYENVCAVTEVRERLDGRVPLPELPGRVGRSLASLLPQVVPSVATVPSLFLARQLHHLLLMPLLARRCPARGRLSFPFVLI